MIYKAKIANIKILRKSLIPVLSFFDFSIKIKHDITNRSMFLKSWSHRGYWYYGKLRESNEIDFYTRFIEKGSVVLEVGGHIGYMTQLFEKLVGENGKVIVLEPSVQNYRLLQKNISNSTIALNIAASNLKGKMNFYTEDYGGFTNSLNKDFVSKSVLGNSESQNFKNHKINFTEIDVDTIDNILKNINYTADFVKIDVEGAELLVLSGMINTILNIKAIMIEISQDHHEIFDILNNNNFKRVNKNGEFDGSTNFEISRNYFYIHNSIGSK